MAYDSIISTVHYGKFVIDLARVLESKGLSKTRLAKLTNTNYKNIKRLCDEEVQKVDLDIMARICYVLKCDISDIVKYTD